MINFGSGLVGTLLPRTTERPVRKRGDEPRTISTQTSATIVRGDCFEIPRPVSVSAPAGGQRPKATDESPWYGVYSLH